VIGEPYMPSEKDLMFDDKGWSNYESLRGILEKTQIGGDHYKSKTIQPWDAMESWMTPEEFIGFLWGNVIKYIARWRDKGGLEDLEKAQHYLGKLVEVMRQAQP